MPHNGILYFGLNGNEFIFHKYFEDVDFKDETRNVFQDGEAIDFHDKDDFEEWTHQNDFTVDSNLEGVLHFKYSDHEIRIYPLRNDLLQQELSLVQ